MSTFDELMKECCHAGGPCVGCPEVERGAKVDFTPGTPSEEACEVCGGDLLDGDEPGAVMATATMPSILVCSERCTEVAGLRAWQELRRIAFLSWDARRQLLDDEGERGALYQRDILELHTHAAVVLHMVATS